MIEEVKTDNSCIIRAFENNPISILKENIDDKHIYYFRASDIGKVLGIVNIRTSIMNFDEDEKVVRTTYSSNSGNPDTIFLTSQGVYRLLYNSKKDIAKKFRKWAGSILDDIIFNESKEIKLQLKEHKRLLKEKEKIISDNICNKKNERHQLLIDKFKFKKCVYVAEICDNLIKIGSSKNIEDRQCNLKTMYNKCIFLDIFETDNYRDLEESILSDDKIIPHLYKKPVNKNQNPKEIIKLSDNFTYLHLIEIIKDYAKQVVILSPSQRLESKRIDFLEYLIKEKGYSLHDIEKLSNIKFNIENDKINEQQNNHQINKELLDNKIISYKTNPVVKKLIKARCINKIDPDTLNILETYESIGTVINNHKEENFEYNALYRSIINNNIYKNYRWNYYNKDIQPTVGITKFSNPVEQIVKLNKDKTAIVEIYKTKKELINLLKTSYCKLKKVMENKSIFNGYYYVKISECKDLLSEYLNNNKLKEYENPCSKKIKQINVLTKNEIIYNSMYDIYKAHGLCRQTIKKYINLKKEYCGFIWEYAN